MAAVVIAIYFVYLSLGHHQRIPSMVHYAGEYMSARLGQTASPQVVRAASEVFSAIKSNTVTLIDCAEHTMKDATGWKKMDISYKQRVEAAARKWLKEHHNAVIMIFAPWCPHCHKMMGPFSDSAATTTFPFVMINAEALPRSAWSGKDAIFDCEYFPTFVVKSGDRMRAVSHPDAAVKVLEYETTNVKDPEQPGSTSSDQDKSNTEKMLDKLF